MDILDDKIKELKKYLINDIIDIAVKKTGKKLEKVLGISKKLEFTTKNIDGYVGYAEYGEGEAYIAVIVSLDNKESIISTLYALKSIKDSNIKLNKKVRIIFITNEEDWFKDIKHYLKKEKLPIMGFISDFKDTVLCEEKGIDNFSIQQSINIENIKLYQNSINDKNLKNCCIEIPKEYIYDDIICYLEDKANSDEGIVSTYKNINIKINEKYVIINSFVNNDIAKLKDYGDDVMINLVNYLLEENLIEHEGLNNYFTFIAKNSNIIKKLKFSYESVTGLDAPLITTVSRYSNLIPHIVSFGPFSFAINEIECNSYEDMNIDNIIFNTRIFAYAIYELAKEV